MSWTAWLVLLIPSALWSVIAVHLARPFMSSRTLLIGFTSGGLITVPIYWIGLITDPFLQSNDRWVQDYLDSFVSAAVVEEGLKFLCAALLLSLLKPRDHRYSLAEITALTLSVAIGFMTVENVLAVAGSCQATAMAIDRAVAALAGHAGFQIIMAWLICKALQDRRALWWVLSLVIPILVHGWLDFIEQAFQDEPNPNSAEDTLLYETWVGSVLMTVVLTMILLRQSFLQKAGH